VLHCNAPLQQSSRNGCARIRGNREALGAPQSLRCSAQGDVGSSCAADVPRKDGTREEAVIIGGPRPTACSGRRSGRPRRLDASFGHCHSGLPGAKLSYIVPGGSV